MRFIIWSDLAKIRLKEIFLYIAQFDEEAAEILVNAFYEKIDMLEKFPRMGRVVPEKADPKIREIFLKKYRIIYHLNQSTIEILTIYHGSQEFQL
jgi:toxin ParE1/3/4